MTETKMKETMKEHVITPPETEMSEVFDVESVKDGSLSGFRLKASMLRQTGRLHFQFTCPDVEGLHSDIQRNLGTPFVQGSNALRNYGVSFDLSVASGTKEQTDLMSLGEWMMENAERVTSLASEDDGYVMMHFDGIVKGHNNAGERTWMMKFSTGSEKRKILVAYSRFESTVQTSTGNYPELRPEWFMAWLTERYLASAEEEE